MRYSDLARFLVLALAAFVPAIVGMVRGGYGWWLIPYGLFWVIFFCGLEIRVLCSHCPFYAKPGAFLECPANYGLPKLWRYRPEPMALWEKVVLLICFALLLGYPLPFLFIGRQFTLLGITAVAIVVWATVMQFVICRRCVNFSCPLNRVPEADVDAFLARNPTMRQAWEKQHAGGARQ